MYRILTKSLRRTKGQDRNYKVTEKLHEYGYAKSIEQFEDLGKSLWALLTKNYWKVKMTWKENSVSFIYTDDGITWHKWIFVLTNM